MKQNKKSRVTWVGLGFIFRSSLIFLFISIFVMAFQTSSISAADLEVFTFKLDQSTAGYQFWTTTPAERVFKDDAVPTATGAEVKVYAAQNEFEPFQVVVKPSSSGGAIINIGDLGGGIETEIYQVKYVNIAQATDSLGKTGDYPDPLWPVEKGASVSLSANVNTAFWFSVKVPKATASGDYTTNVQIGGVNIPVRLHVFNFAVPDELHVKSQMNVSHEKFLEYYSVMGTGNEYWMYVNKIKQFFIDHRLTPKSALWSGGLTSSGGKPYIDYDCATEVVSDNDGIWGFEINASKYLNGEEITGQSANNGIFNDGTGFPSFMAATFQNNDSSVDQRPSEFCGITRGTGDWYTANNPTSTFNTKWFNYFYHLQEYVRGLGFLDKAYYYFANEPQDQADYDAVAWYSRYLKQAAPDFKLMVSEEPKTEIYDHADYTSGQIDIWLPVIQNYDPSVSHDREQNHGEESWIYFLYGTRPPYFNPITLDHPGIESKLTGWFLWKYRIRGIAYYSLSNWSKNPWTDPMTDGHNGDLFMLYPPSESNTPITYGSNNHRFVPSIRFELMRDSLEDFEYLYVLNGGKIPLVTEDNTADDQSADAQAGKIISGLTSYTRDAEFMYNLRKLIGLRNYGKVSTFIPPTPTSAPTVSTPPELTVADVMYVTSTATAGTYTVGSVIQINVCFSDLVWVKGTPQLVLRTGETPGKAYYSNGSGTDTLTFLYTVAVVDTVSELDYWSEWGLELNGGQIYNNQGVDADLTLPAPGEPGSLSGNIALSLDTDYPVYRFYSPGLLKHLFTIDENEKEHLIANAADVWQSEGIAYYAFHPSQYNAASRLQKNMLLAVHRFYSEGLHTHLFTTDENEKEHLIANAADVWRYEGPAFYVPAGYQEGTIPVYRFYSEALKVHLFTVDENEKNHLIDTAGDVWRFEGIAYYAYP
ncbi:DUF4091 domain-containing protein [Desulfococcaceae bacterium HSG7]|nr:DUF4091 domain-containing protein [Desulfococcaceae bacterium HSG7]